MANAKRVSGKLFGGAVLAGAMLAFGASRADAGLMLDIRLAGGGKELTNASVGQNIGLEVWAVVDGAAGNAAPEGFWNAFFNVVSNKVGAGGFTSGDMSQVTNLPPFDANGSQRGKVQDLNADGDLDVGGTSSGPDWAFARALDTQVGSEFKISSLTYTVKNVNAVPGAKTTINLQTRVRSITVQPASWQEDGVAGQKPANGAKVPVGSDVVLLFQEVGPTAKLEYGSAGDGAQGVVHMMGAPAGYISDVLDVQDTGKGSVALDINPPGPPVPPVLAVLWLSNGGVADLKALLPALDYKDPADYARLMSFYTRMAGEAPDALVLLPAGKVAGGFINWDFGTSNLQVDKIAAVPEPASLSLLGLGALGLLARRRRA